MSWRTIPAPDWQRLYPGLAILLGSILGAGGIAVWQQAQRHDLQLQLAAAHQQWQQSHAATQALRQRLIQAQDEQQYLMQPGKLDRLQAAEQRLEWLEHLAQIGRQDPSLQLKYQIEAQQALLPAPYSGNATLFSSRMQIQYLARHEADFSSVHQRISQIPGLALPLSCKISRSPLADAALEVNCDYAWLSVGAPPAPSKHPS